MTIQEVLDDYENECDYTGVDASATGLTYDAGAASVEDAEPSRNW